jgi:urease alpha subunit
MMNYALFTGLLHSGATPITDDPFHSQVFAHKLQRMAQEPAIRQAIAGRADQRKLKAGTLAAAALTDAEASCPSCTPRCRWLRFSSTGRRIQMPSPRFARRSD